MSGCAVEGDQTFGDGFYDLFVDFVDAEIAFDDDDAVGFATGDLAVLLPHAAEELALLLLEAVFILAGFGGVLLVAAACAGEACVERWKQQQGEVGLKVAADEAVEFENAL